MWVWKKFKLLVLTLQTILLIVKTYDLFAYIPEVTMNCSEHNGG
jgi:hypothetical protein